MARRRKPPPRHCRRSPARACCWSRTTSNSAASPPALLQAHGAQVVRAADAAEALQRMAAEPPFDAVLSDVVMPGSADGLALARQLKREHPALPVLLISGNVAAGTAGDDFIVLSKPCPQHELLAALHAAIAGAHTRQAPR
jgi:CheY-like chemotaxis protein